MVKRICISSQRWVKRPRVALL